MAQAVSRKAQESIFTGAFSSYSVDDISEAKEFYEKLLGINVEETDEGLELNIDDSGSVFIYPKEDHEPATFTVLNFAVEDIDSAVDELTNRGITFESFQGELETDEKGIFRGADTGAGPNIAWFKDPAGNYLSIIES